MKWAQGVLFIMGVYGEAAGLALIALVSAWDLLISGFRGFFEWNIGFMGITLIWLGVGLIVASKHIDKTF